MTTEEHKRAILEQVHKAGEPHRMIEVLVDEIAALRAHIDMMQTDVRDLDQRTIGSVMLGSVG
jgi:antitoxin component HigA of HigAB toxin-antitoxin module